MARKTIKTPRAGKPRTATARARQLLRQTWANALQSLTKAEAEAEKQVKALLEKNRINVDDAAEMLRDFRASVDKERKRGMQELGGRLQLLQARVKKETRNVVKRADEAVQGALAALNIPSRREVAQLTGKVEELSKRIATMRRRRK